MYRYGTLTLILALVPGCFLWFPPDGEPTGPGELKRFESEQELAEYFTDQVKTRNTTPDRGGELGDVSVNDDSFDNVAAEPTEGLGGGVTPPTPQDGAAGAETEDVDSSTESYSGTTIQEAGVDEADVVKTDGTFLYIIHDEKLRIVRVSPREQFGLVSEIELDGYGREMYLHDGKAVALTETYGYSYGFVGWDWDDLVLEDVDLSETDAADAEAEVTVVDAPGGDPLPDIEEPPPAPADAESDDDAERDNDSDPDPDDETTEGDEADGEEVEVEPDVAPDGDIRWEKSRTLVTIFDVSTPEEPVQLSQTAFEGTQSSSRMIDGVLHLVVANYEMDFYSILPVFAQPEDDLNSMDVSTLLPWYEQTDAEGNTTNGPVLTWEELYRPTDPDGYGVLAVISMDVDDPKAEFSAVGIVAEPGLIYSSIEALYLTDNSYDIFWNTRSNTDIYKLAYSGTGTVPVAAGSVPGRVLDQYSMGEYNGYLRVATTVWSSDWWDDPSNSVYVLGEVDGALETVGSIENIAEGETIQSARFMGPKGYLVTFEQIDPLFTLDLSEPTEPRVVGELKVPGFSTFIVPMDESHLLTVGQYVPEDGSWWETGVQLSIFDVSDFANPTLAHHEVIGAHAEAWSEAQYNPKAFTYFAEQGLVALPIELWDSAWWFVDEDVAVDDETREGASTTVATDPAVPDEPADDEEGTDSTAADEDVADGVAPSAPEYYQGLFVYRVSTESGFEELGHISTSFSDDPWYYWTAFTRGKFVLDEVSGAFDVFAVTNLGVRGARVDRLETVMYEVMFETEDPFIDDDLVEIPPEDIEPVTGGDADSTAGSGGSAGDAAWDDGDAEPTDEGDDLTDPNEVR